jgi:hypothetical protein
MIAASSLTDEDRHRSEVGEQEEEKDDFEKGQASQSLDDDSDDESASLLDHALQKEDGRYAILDSTLEQLGFGPFQHRLLVLTGFGTFVDALEANLISILYPVL